MTDVSITLQPAMPLYAFEIWSNPEKVAARFKAATGFALPTMGHSQGNAQLELLRFEPTVWLVKGDATALAEILGDDGALTAIGGGIVRVSLSGKGWRALLMEGGLFDAETPVFGPGCCAATVIDHVNVRLHVVAHDACDAYLPLSFSTGLVQFWTASAQELVS